MMAGVKLADERGVHIVESLFYRQALALPIVMLWLMLGPGLASVRTKKPGAHASRTVVGLGGMIFNFLGVVLLPLAEATTLGFTAPVFATILSAIILRERTGIHRWGAVIAGFIGMLIIVQPQGDHYPLLGAGIALSGAFMVAIVSILLRQLSRTEEPATIVFWFVIFSLPPLGLGLFFFGRLHDPMTWALLLFIGTVGGLGQIFLTASLKWAPVSVVLPMDYSSLIWATFYGWLFWGYWPGPSTWAGGGLIIASGLYIAWRERVRRAPASAAPVVIDQV